MMEFQNFGYQSPQQFQTPMSTMNNIGGYPNGYPPDTPQTMGSMGYPMVQQMPGQSVYSPFVSPFPSPQPMPQYMSPIVPGVTVPLEMEDGKGNSITVPPSTGFNPGGATISQGGFNPVNGVTTMPSAEQGYNPFTKFIGNPGYAAPQMGVVSLNPSIPGQPQIGFSPYSPQPRIPLLSGMYGYNNYYNQGQNQFNLQLQEALYEMEPSIIDAREMLAQVVLTDEEREKINHRGYVVGYDYYGNPIYNNGINGAYYANQQRQQEFEDARLAYQKHFTMLSKIAHAYSGETIDEEAAMRRFDPVPPQPKQKQKVFDYYHSTPEERKEYEREARVQAAADLTMRIQQYDYNMAVLQQQKEYAMEQVKASHDRLIGVEPGEHYDLKTFLDNGYKIGVNIAMQKAKSANRNGTNKYSRNDFRARLSQSSNAAVPITSKDDEYVSIEQMLKGVYDRNKRDNAILRNQNGQTTYTSEPAFNSEFDAHMYFLKAMQEKKDKDDIRRSVM